MLLRHPVLTWMDVQREECGLCLTDLKEIALGETLCNVSQKCEVCKHCVIVPVFFFFF